jgi:hypothetical protein
VFGANLATVSASPPASKPASISDAGRGFQKSGLVIMISTSPCPRGFSVTEPHFAMKVR